MNESEINDHSMFNIRKRGLICKTERDFGISSPKFKKYFNDETYKVSFNCTSPKTIDKIAEEIQTNYRSLEFSSNRK